MNAIETVDLTKKYKDVVAVDGLNLQIRQGELFALLGVNGAGKTTAVKMLSGLTPPDGGDAFLLGNSVASQPMTVKSYIGVSPQETAIAPNLTVEENLRLMCGIHDFSREKTEGKVKQLVEQFDLEKIRRKRAGKLSGGWQRRLSIAMALTGEPRILFLDEPTLGLDVLARSDLWDMIRRMKGEMTLLLTTHYMEEAEALADRVGIMREGRLLALDTPAALKAQTGKEKFEDAFIAIVRGR